MAPTPFRRKPGKTARNLALAEAALALAKSRQDANARRSGGRGKLLLAGGALVAAGAAALLKRDKVAGLLPSRSGDGDTAPATPQPPTPPQPSNYDAPGPVHNTATPIPAPDPAVGAPGPIDEAAEEAAAAAEAAAIGGQPSEYAGPELGEVADEAYRPLAEAGQGEAEGQEQAEAELADNATYRDAGFSGAGAQIEDAIDAAGQPSLGETPEPLAPTDFGPGEAETRSSEEQTSFLPPTPAEPPAETVSPSDPAPAEPAGADEAPLTAPEPSVPGTAEPAAPDDTGSEAPSERNSDDDWRTWSGRSVNP